MGKNITEYMQKLRTFQNLETIGGILLFSTALIAIIVANTPWGYVYTSILNTYATFSIGTFEIKKPLQLWVNDGLMALYFLLVGLEIKREIKRGVLSNMTSIIVPLIAACFGLMFPAIINIMILSGNEVYLKGWAVPTATDIAFTLGIVSLLGSRVPISMKVLLTAIAIFDDIGAIIIIAIFYTSKLSQLSIFCASLAVVLLMALNAYQCKRISVYMVVGVFLWAAVLKSGIHATLAGIVIAMAIPDEGEESLLVKLEQSLHPWIVFLILPIFAFVNAGVSFTAMTMDFFSHPLFIGISLGLFLGKQIGVFLPLWYFVRFKHYLYYENITLKHVYGIALICGVGFTMSLFVGSLAFKGPDLYLMSYVKMGVLVGSLLSGTLGYLILRTLKPRESNDNES